MRFAVTRIQPLAMLCAAAVNMAVVAPCTTVAVAGTVIAALLLETATVILLAGFESVIVQVVLVPTVSLFERHASDDNVGVDQRVRVVL